MKDTNISPIFLNFMKQKKHNNWLIIYPINNTQTISVGHITNGPIKKIIGKQHVEIFPCPY